MKSIHSPFWLRRFHNSIFNFQLLLLGLFLLSLSACNTTEKIVYFQDMSNGMQLPAPESADIVIMPKDLISIAVSSRDFQLAALFNLPRASYQLGSETGGGGNSGGVLGYTVDAQGNIDFPVLGTIYVQGLTRKQLAVLIKERLLREDLIKDPVVTVDFMNLKISVLGEVVKPGPYNIERDQITILEALSMAGDLTIYGCRDGVLVLREENGIRTTYRMDLRNSELFSSPAYYLQQNDVVYVEPNSVRAGQSTINENNVKSVSLWISLASFLTSLGVLIFK